MKNFLRATSNFISHLLYSVPMCIAIMGGALTNAAGIEDLPFEMREQILHNVKVKDILAFCSTSKQFLHHCESNNLWKILVERDFGKNIAQLKDEEHSKENYIIFMNNCFNSFFDV